MLKIGRWSKELKRSKYGRYQIITTIKGRIFITALCGHCADRAVYTASGLIMWSHLGVGSA